MPTKTRSQITSEAMGRKATRDRGFEPRGPVPGGPFANGPRFGGPKKGRPVPKRKAKLAPDKGGRRYLAYSGDSRRSVRRSAEEPIRRHAKKARKPLLPR